MADKFIKNACSLFHSHMLLPHTFHKSICFFHKLFADSINFLNTSFFHSPIAAYPVLLPLFPAPDSHSDAIIFQLIRFINRQPGQTAPQITENTFIRKLFRQHIKSSPQIFHKRIHQQTMLFINKTGNPTGFHDLAGIHAIGRKIAGNDGKIPIPIPLCTHKKLYLFHNFFHLCQRIGGAENLHLLLFFIIRLSSKPEQMLFQKFQSGCMGKAAFRSR